MKRLLALALGLCLSASPALAVGITQISGSGTGGAIVGTAFNAGASINGTTTADIPPGSLIIAITQGTSSVQNFSCSDAYGNSYSAGQATASQSGANTRIIYSYTGFDVPNGGTITCSVTGANGIDLTVLAFSGSASSPYDSASASSVAGTGTGALTIGPTGTLNGPCGSANCEVLIGANIWHSNGTVANDATFTNVMSGSSTPFAIGFKIVSSTLAISYSISTGAPSSAHAGMLQGFMAASAGSAKLPCVIGSGLAGC